MIWPNTLPMVFTVAKIPISVCEALRMWTMQGMKNGTATWMRIPERNRTKGASRRSSLVEPEQRS